MDERIEQAKRGDRAALNDLVAEHYPFVYRFAARRLGPELGQDAAQETFLTMQKAIKSFQGSSSFRTWLLGIAHNQVRWLSRKRRQEPARLEDWLEQAGPQPEEGLLSRQALSQALQRLSEEHRQVVLMHEIEGLKYSEIASILSIPEGTVKSRLHHAFRSLRAALQEA